MLKCYCSSIYTRTSSVFRWKFAEVLLSRQTRSGRAIVFARASSLNLNKISRLKDIIACAVNHGTNYRVILIDK